MSCKLNCIFFSVPLQHRFHSVRLPLINYNSFICGRFIFRKLCLRRFRFRPKRICKFNRISFWPRSFLLFIINTGPVLLLLVVFSVLTIRSYITMILCARLAFVRIIYYRETKHDLEYSRANFP